MAGIIWDLVPATKGPAGDQIQCLILPCKFSAFRGLSIYMGGWSTWAPKTAKPHKILGKNEKPQEKLGKPKNSKLLALAVNSR